MLTKEQIVEAIRAMPEEELDIKVLAERLLLLNQLQQAEDDIKNDRVYTHEQMKEIIKSWQQSSGQKRPTVI